MPIIHPVNANGSAITRLIPRQKRFLHYARDFFPAYLVCPQPATNGFAVKKTATGLLQALSLTGLLLLSYPAQAYDTRLVYGPNNNNKPVFEIHFYDEGDGPFMSDDPTVYESTFNLSPQQKDKIATALSYWAEVITPAPDAETAIVNVGTFNDRNAAGSSHLVYGDDSAMTQLDKVLNHLQLPEDAQAFGSDAQFVIGTYTFDEEAYLPSQLPRFENVDLVATSIHELAHGLGIAAQVNDQGDEIHLSPYFADELFLPWAAHLYDDNGNPAQPGQPIWCEGCDNPDNPDDPPPFDLRRDQGYFSGEHVEEVLNGAMPGVPIKISGSDDGTIDNDYIDHIELKNSLMSHQKYSNYTTFMEAELAVLQDMGYQIDRRNFFGFSVYNDHQTVYNRNGYSLRNQQGNGYIPGKYNTATLGLGLHVYGSYNHIFQIADLLTKGGGAAGVRVDGEGNTLVVEPHTRIYADGLNGRGVMFAYGKDHHFVLRGDVQALGKKGIAASFDFGNNNLGNNDEYRGSYIYEKKGNSAELLPELAGALVDTVDISGRLAGTDAAIYISNNALVNHINIMQGAQLKGNIYSYYWQEDDFHHPRLTQLSFGLLADADGRATGQADADFRLRYDGNIDAKNMQVSIQGGTTSLNGTHDVYSVNIAKNATLAGNSVYTLSPAEYFVNNGVLSPGNSFGEITINGNYQQGETGELLLEMDNSGQHDRFTVSGHARLAGLLTVNTLPGWYAPGWQMTLTDLVNITDQEGDFTQIRSAVPSPTLTLQRISTPAGEALSLSRAANAYSRYGRDANAQQAGQALDRIAPQAQPAMQAVYQQLDFSPADGHVIRRWLDQLTPAGYSAMLAASLHREQQITDIISEHSNSSLSSADGWNSFAIPFGSGFRQQSRQDYAGYQASGYGVLFGAEKQGLAGGALTAGVHAAVSGQSLSLKSPGNGNGKITAFNVGIQGRYAADAQAGSWLFASGRVGLENGRLDRQTGIPGLVSNEQNHADWSGISGSLTAGGGYQWELTRTLRAGPLATLDYNLLSRRQTAETGNTVSRLTLDKITVHSLRSRLGVSGDWTLPLASGARLTTRLQLSWDHELLDNSVTQTAWFTDYPAAPFHSKNHLSGRDTLHIQAAIHYQMTENLQLSASLGTDQLRPGYQSLTGNAAVRWRF